MKKHKNTKHHIIKRGWIIFGVIIFLWTAFWFVKARIINQYPFIANAIMLTIGYTLLIDYLLATSVYWAIKKLKNEWEIKE
jgi:hypothetical protein